LSFSQNLEVGFDRDLLGALDGAEFPEVDGAGSDDEGFLEQFENLLRLELSAFFVGDGVDEAAEVLLKAFGELVAEFLLEHIGDAYEKLGKTTEALIYWQKAHGLDPKNPTLAEKLDLHSSKVAKQPEAQP
jgi:tetratricopeptide (TPR) repeat protein